MSRDSRRGTQPVTLPAYGQSTRVSAYDTHRGDTVGDTLGDTVADTLGRAEMENMGD
jgi:hypothetical protein